MCIYPLAVVAQIRSHLRYSAVRSASVEVVDLDRKQLVALCASPGWRQDDFYQC